MNIPQVRFIYAYPLDQNRRRFFKEKDLGAYPSTDEVKAGIKHWEQVWNEANQDDRVIRKLIEITHRTPERALECFAIGRGLNPMSTPFIMPVMSRSNERISDEYFVQTMIHELLHIFVTTNTDEYWSMVRSKFSEESALTQNHIIIFATLAKVYQELFNHLPLDFLRTDLPDGYLQAMSIVKEKGHDELIAGYNSLVN